MYCVPYLYNVYGIWLCFTGTLMAGNNAKQNIINRVQEIKCFNTLPSTKETEIVSVTDVLNQLTALRQVQLAGTNTILL